MKTFDRNFPACDSLKAMIRLPMSESNFFGTLWKMRNGGKDQIKPDVS